jgi:hypothetical protein
MSKRSERFEPQSEDVRVPEDSIAGHSDRVAGAREKIVQLERSPRPEAGKEFCR